MPPLDNGLRNDLEAVVKKARVIAERGARSVIESLTVHEARAGGHLDDAGKALRNRLRVHGRQLGDRRTANGVQEITRLVRECAYEHWHRMLFARFLAENELLIHPEHNVSVSLDDVEDLAREVRVDKWELASRFATGMLPQIFRPDDPVLAIALPRERTLELEQLLESLPAATFKADDSLGWVYQFWQVEEKDRVNASGEKITGETLPAVTQLFTENYMVLFLLHNTIGAWHAGKVLQSRDADQSRDREGAENAFVTEAEARAAVALPDYQFEYLRFVREPCEGDEDGEPTGPWRPAAGTFDGWPPEAKDLKVLDPCCGSGHFLVEVFLLLVRLRMAEEGLSLEAAIRAVLADNLFGLELDARCTQIAAFNLALAAWRMVGRPIDLPTMNIACCGIGPHCTEDEWLKLAEGSGVAMPAIGREPIRNGLRNMHALFSQAPELGALIDPTELPGDLIAADWETLQPYLTGILRAESRDEEARERAVAARGMARAAEILAGEYALVITNVPYLASGKQSDILRAFIGRKYRDSKGDLGTVFIERSLDLASRRGTAAVVVLQSWLYLPTYKRLRGSLLGKVQWDAVARLGPGAFGAISGEVVNVCLFVATAATPGDDGMIPAVDASTCTGPREKAEELRNSQLRLVVQTAQLKNPDHRFIDSSGSVKNLLLDVADGFKGLSTGDLSRFIHSHWEMLAICDGWVPFQGSTTVTGPYMGRVLILKWDDGRGPMVQSPACYVKGQNAWGKQGISIGQTTLKSALYTGEMFDENAAAVVVNNVKDLAAVWAYCSSDEFAEAIRQVDRALKVTNKTLVKVPFDLAHWQKVAAEKYPDGLPEPESDDPTQWLFHGRPEESTAPLQVAVARLLGYRWPAELDDEMRLSERARALVQRCEGLARFADNDGIVCIPALRGERSAADRLLALLNECGVRPDRDLDAWLRNDFFAEHCTLFHHRPFVWHIWDGRKDGFHALVNYHKLAAPGGAGKRLLESLTHSYLGDWIKTQKAEVHDGKPGAEARLTAALELREELEKILTGEPPYDIFVRWKPLHEQPIGWAPDINDGVRLNIRPFLMAKDVGRKGAGVLRWKPNIKWTKDRGKEPQSLRPKADFPWFWSCDPEKHAAHRKDFGGGDKFDGNRWNDLHYTNAFKQAARERSKQETK